MGFSIPVSKASSSVSPGASPSQSVILTTNDETLSAFVSTEVAEPSDLSGPVSIVLPLSKTISALIILSVCEGLS